VTRTGPLKIRLGSTRRGSPADPRQRRVAFAAASALLRYPDEQLVSDLSVLGAATAALAPALREPFARLGDHLSARPLLDSQAYYVATFDMKRRCCLYLSYYLNGDTRRRGLALWRFQDAYRRAGYQVAQGELPDYLPALLELAASGGEAEAVDLMVEHRAGIHVLMAALDEMDSPYAGVVRAVDSLLPAPAPRLIATAALLAQEGPPSELVGIEAVEGFEPYNLLSACDGPAPGETAAPGAARSAGKGPP
jgi:nitrate reductase molybdenum cofactor assembly chaperone NarJ/NarW